jgi:Ser/Thr protein kinase RdoA (MazF antagonist)
MLDATLAEAEAQRPEDLEICRWHLARARERAAGIDLSSRPGLINHGDFTTWNLHFRDGKLTGILDFELAHWDHRVAEFNYSWRGRYDGVVHGYNEVSPLEPEEWEMLTPLWWAQLVDLACRMLRRGTWDDDWVVKKLLERTELMREPGWKTGR